MLLYTNNKIKGVRIVYYTEVTKESFRPAPRQLTLKEFKAIIKEYKKRGGSLESQKEAYKLVVKKEMSPNLFHFDMLDNYEIIKPFVKWLEENSEDTPLIVKDIH